MKNKTIVIISITVIVCLILSLTPIAIVEANPVVFPYILIKPLSPYRAVLFNASDVELSIYVSVQKNYTELHSVYYSLDGIGNYTLTVSKASDVEYRTQVTLEDLANGNHTINVYADFVDGKTTANGGTFIVDAPASPATSSSPLSNPTTNPTESPTTSPTATPSAPEFPALLIVLALMLIAGSVALLTLKKREEASEFKRYL